MHALRHWNNKVSTLNPIKPISVHWLHQDSGIVSIDRLLHQRQTGGDHPHPGGLSGSGAAIGTFQSRSGSRNLFGQNFSQERTGWNQDTDR